MRVGTPKVSLFNAYMSLSGAYDAEVIREEKLSHRTTYRIGGPADLFVCVHSYPALKRTLEVLAREDIEWVILGKGSNVLVSDAGYRGCVIELGREFSRLAFFEDGRVTVGAGVLLPKLVRETLSHSLSGIEFCMGIPGTVGGAISMDAGSRHHWIGHYVQSVVIANAAGSLRRLSSDEIEWGYRWCSIDPAAIILEVDLLLKPGSKDAIAAEMNRRTSQRRRAQPLGLPSCGSVFRNPPDGSAAKMIERCGLKGRSVGGAQISKMHANFIVNAGGATAADVVALMREVHEAVQERFGVDLSCEVKFLGFGA